MPGRFIQVAVCVALAVLVAGARPVHAEPEPAGADALIIQATDHADLSKKFCAANPRIEHILVLPAALFVDSEQVICPNGPYKLYRLVEHDDTDDFEYFLDPPSYSKEIRLGCDGKAGKTMKTIAVNCRPLR